jgi:hypothetical protein
MHAHPAWNNFIADEDEVNAETISSLTKSTQKMMILSLTESTKREIKIEHFPELVLRHPASQHQFRVSHL